MIRNWYKVLPQVILMINLLQFYHIFPQLSAYASFHRSSDHNRTTIVPTVTKFIIHKSSATRGTLSAHGVSMVSRIFPTALLLLLCCCWWYQPQTHHQHCIMYAKKTQCHIYQQQNYLLGQTQTLLTKWRTRQRPPQSTPCLIACTISS